jgi:hypothetical protein
MRAGEARYQHEIESIDLALRFIRLEARTSTIRAFTGLSCDRIRKLSHQYAHPSYRHRGKSPHQAGYFIRSAKVRHQASFLAGVLCSCGLSIDEPSAGATFACLATGELLFDAYEYYRQVVSTPVISFEYAVFLAQCLLRGDQLRLVCCVDCNIPLLAEPFPEGPRRCDYCEPDYRRRRTSC